MRILTILLSMVIIGICASCTTPQNTKEANNPPNVILIYADDLGYGDVGAYGSTEIRTPNMDMLAEGGERNRNANASSSTCSPSRYAM